MDALDTEWQQNLKEKIATRTACVAVIGLGYVGLPLAVTFARNGFPVIGIDIDERKVDMLARGESYVEDVGTDEIQRLKVRKLKVSCFMMRR